MLKKSARPLAVLVVVFVCFYLVFFVDVPRKACVARYNLARPIVFYDTTRCSETKNEIVVGCGSACTSTATVPLSGVAFQVRLLPSDNSPTGHNAYLNMTFGNLTITFRPGSSVSSETRTYYLPHASPIVDAHKPAVIALFPNIYRSLKRPEPMLLAIDDTIVDVWLSPVPRLDQLTFAVSCPLQNYQSIQFGITTPTALDRRQHINVTGKHTWLWKIAAALVGTGGIAAFGVWLRRSPPERDFVHDA
jgi:hypothetical protein